MPAVHRNFGDALDHVEERDNSVKFLPTARRVNTVGARGLRGEQHEEVDHQDRVDAQLYE